MLWKKYLSIYKPYKRSTSRSMASEPSASIPIGSSAAFLLIEHKHPVLGTHTGKGTLCQQLLLLVLPDQGQRSSVTYACVFKTSLEILFLFLTCFMFSTTRFSEVCYGISERHCAKNNELPSESVGNTPLIRDTHLGVSTSLWEIKWIVIVLTSSAKDCVVSTIKQHLKKGVKQNRTDLPYLN